MPVLLYLPSVYQAGFVNISASIWTYLGNHPGATAAEMASGLSINLAQVSTAVETLNAQFVVVRRYDAAGVPGYWKSSQYEALIVANLGAARSWMASHSGSDVTAMASALSLHYGVAMGLAEALQAEASCKMLSA